MKRDAFALGVGTTIGSLPDTGYAISAKVLLILSLPGPRIFLQGKGSFIETKPENKDEAQEGTFEALLVLDTPAQLFQANLAITFKMGALLEVGGGVDAAFSWAKDPPPDVSHVYVGEKAPEERRVHAKVLEFLKGDTWLMINRPHYVYSADAQRLERKGDFEMGGSLTLGADFDFTVVKMWLRASIYADAAVTWEPQQIVANALLNGSAGIMALGMELSAELNADALAKASKPLYFGASVEVEVRVNLIFFKWQFHEKISIEYTRPELPDYVRNFVALKADHMKASEARDLSGAVVPPDARPVVIFSKPVRDLAWFGAPGDPNLPIEDLKARQVSYQLRHVVLLANDGTDAAPSYRFVCAAGRARVTGANVEFIGVGNNFGPLPDLAGCELRLFAIGDKIGQTFPLSAGSAGSATLTGSAPQGELCYRLSAARPTASVTISGVADAGFSQIEATLVGTLANPQRFRGGRLGSGSATWTIVNASASTVRRQSVDGASPSPAAATLAGPDPAQLMGHWQAAGDPVEGAGSSTRLQVWGRTPYAMFRYNELETLEELDALAPDYACGPTPVERPVCTHFEDVAEGPLAHQFRHRRHSGHARRHDQCGWRGGRTETARLWAHVDHHGYADVRPAGRRRVGLGHTPGIRRHPRVQRRHENRRASARAAPKPLPVRWRHRAHRDRRAGRERLRDLFHARLALCRFHEQFPEQHHRPRQLCGMLFGSAATLSVTAGVLHAVPRRRPLSDAIIVRTIQPSAFGETATADLPVIEVPGLEAAFIAVTPLLDDVRFEPGTRSPEPAARVLPSDRALTRALARIETMPRRIDVHEGSIWKFDRFERLVTLTIDFERPVTRTRIELGQQPVSAVALAGTLPAATASGAPGTTLALYADPQSIGWFNRVVLTAPGELEVAEICTDRGDFGWERYQQWTWRQGVQRSIESLYSDDPVLPPGRYELRVHTAAVVTGEQPTTEDFMEPAKFRVGSPPGFAPRLVNPIPPGTDPRVWNYPDGGPLTPLETYVDRTIPVDGARLWYRCLDTAVGFNENYVTRMYLEADEELRVLRAQRERRRLAQRHTPRVGRRQRGARRDDIALRADAVRRRHGHLRQHRREPPRAA